MTNNIHEEAKQLYARGYKHLIFIEDRKSCTIEHFYTKRPEDVGLLMREDWPTFTITSVWDLDMLFKLPTELPKDS